MKKKAVLLFALLLVAGYSFKARADSFKVVVLKIPHQYETYITFFKELGEATNTVFQIEAVPPARASHMLEDKLADAMIPHLRSKNENFNKTLKIDFTTENLGDVAFVLYTNKSKPLDINSLKNGNSKHYKIETDGSTLKWFGFDAVFSADITQSMKKLNAGRIDGCIYAQPPGDRVLKSLKYTNIKRQLWENFYSSIALQKGQQGRALDKIISEGIRKLRANGKFEQLLGRQNQGAIYNNWQQ